MKKRLLSMLLALCMVLALVPMVPIVANAAEITVVASGICGATESDSVTWVLSSDGMLTLSGAGTVADYSSTDAPWKEFADNGLIKNIIVGKNVAFSSLGVSGCSYTVSSEAALKTAVGNDGAVKLESDITVSETLNIGADVTLDLNGYVLKYENADTDGSVIKVISSGKLTLQDSRANDADAKHYFTVGDDGLWTLSETITENVIIGGVITGGTGMVIDYGSYQLCDGGGVYVDGNSTFIMNSGTIIGNNVNHAGGVYNRGSFTMNGGAIIGNVAWNNGGGIYNSGTFTMNNGSITDNIAKQNGGGVYNKDCTFTMNGGTISDNIANQSGGGVHSGSSKGDIARFIMNDGTIEGNYANATRNSGGGVFISWNGGDSSLEMNGGIIRGNSGNSACGGIFVFSSAKIIVSGSPIVTGNVIGGTKGADGLYTGGTASNVYLYDGRTVTVGSSGFTGSIGVTAMKHMDTPDATVTVATGASSTDVSCFTSDSDNYKVEKNAATGEIQLVRKQKQTVTVTSEAITATYGDSDVSIGASATGDGSLSYTVSEGVDVVSVSDSGYISFLNAGSARITVTASATDRYASATKEITVTVNKAIPAITEPTAQNEITYGAVLSEVGLTDGWNWVDGSTVPTVTNSGYAAYYTPVDINNYNWESVTGWNATLNRVERNVAVTVNEADQTAPTVSGIANGKTYCEAQIVTVADNDIVASVTVNGTPVTLDENGKFMLNPAEGKQTVVATDKAGNKTEITVTVNDGHDYESKVTKEATTTSTGTKTYTCKNCGHYYEEEIAKLPSQSTSPQTGDNSHMPLWFALLLVSGGALIGVAAYGKKKKRSAK